MRPAVLIVAPTDDPHACVVAKRLEALDADAIILDTAHFPSQWQLSVWSANNTPPQFVLAGGGIEIDNENLAGIWWRRPQRYLASDDVHEPHLRRLITSEARAAFEGWLHCLGDRVINPVAADRAASFKPLQLQAATEVGLRIPKTLATNAPVRARAFSDSNGPHTVYKAFTQPSWQLLATQRLSADALEQIDAVSYAPVIFQEEIRKAADIRVTVLDGKVFPVLIKTGLQEPPVDWRIDPAHEYVAHELPTAISAALVALVARLGLRFAACDLALSDDGEYVFLEANTGGQWLFAEIMAEQQISSAFAHALLGSGVAAT